MPERGPASSARPRHPVGVVITKKDTGFVKMDSSIVHSHPEILGGEPVFTGTRVPARNLVEWITGGHRLNEFLDNFPSVTQTQAVGFLHSAVEAVLAPLTSAEAREPDQPVSTESDV